MQYDEGKLIRKIEDGRVRDGGETYRDLAVRMVLAEFDLDCFRKKST